MARAPLRPYLAIYMTVAAVITIVSVLATRETARSSLRHDRVTGDQPEPVPATPGR
jgi:hypothetical protein